MVVVVGRVVDVVVAGCACKTEGGGAPLLALSFWAVEG